MVAESDNDYVKLNAVRAMQPKQMPLREATALLRKLGEFAADPFAAHSWAQPLVGNPDRVRIRQGDWRAVVLIVRVEDAVIVSASNTGEKCTDDPS
jgi:hypothetical protein